MVDIATKIKHTHKFEIIKNRGYCPCGQVLEYSNAGNLKDAKVITINSGDPNYVDPSFPPTSINHPIQDNKPSVAPSIIIPEKTGTGSGKANFERHRYYLQNKEIILADLKSMGVEKMLEKWKIPKPTWSSRTGLAVQWGLIEKPGPVEKKKEIEPVIPTQTLITRFPDPEWPLEAALPALDNIIEYWKDSGRISCETITKITVRYLENYRKILEGKK